MHTNSDPLSVNVPAGTLWHGQLRHALLLAALLPGAWAVAEPGLGDGSWLGIEDRWWFVAAVVVPIVQQVAVVLFWRLQLCHSLVTRVFGDAGFVLWGAVFLPLLVSRPLLTLAVGLADPGSLTIPPPASVTAGALLLVPAAWAAHSVAKHFGIPRALGGDHFFERYRALPMIREGAFRYSSNAMYSIVFLAFWGIALLTCSRAALAVALFQHAYIWVHWYCTEQPDGVVLYGRSQEEN